MGIIGIVLLSVGIAIVYQSGVYGYGVDYYAAYNSDNINWGGAFIDFLGWRLSMLSLDGLLLSQGSRWWLTVCLLLLLAPLHKSGLFFLGAYGMSAGLHLLERWRVSRGLRLFAAVLGAAATYMALLFYLDGEQQSRVIAGDFRAPFLIINCVLAASFWVYRAQSPFFRYSFVFNVIALAVLAVGGNWEYERVNMVYLIPNMLSVALLFQRSARIPLMLFASAALFVMTVWAGMFDALS